MLASALIIVFSVVLLTYWFRYTCILLLKNRPDLSEDAESLPVAGYRYVQQALEQEPKLEKLHIALHRDFEVLTYLVEHASGLRLRSLEDRLLVADYRLMQWRYRLTRSIFPNQARRSLAEMASIMDLLARRVGDQAGITSEV